jgi:hypothetical protein
MSRWFRHYAGMMRDDKLVRVALKVKQPIERVLWVWGAILESAAEINEDGRFDLDPAEAAYFLRSSEDDINTITAGLEALGRVASGCVVKWGDRQYQSDRSSERVRAHRERKRAGDADRCVVGPLRNADETAVKRFRNAPETDTETDTETDQKETTRYERAKVDFDDLMSRLVEAGGKALANPASSPGLLVLSEPLRWLDGGCDLDLDIIPTVAARCARSPPGSKRSWSYFSDAVFAARDARNRPAPEPSNEPIGQNATTTHRPSNGEVLVAGMARALEKRSGGDRGWPPADFSREDADRGTAVMDAGSRFEIDGIAVAGRG